MLTHAIAPPPRLLMGPGPVNADPRVLRAMSAGLVGQVDPAMTAYMNETMELYRRVFGTSNDATLLVDGTSRAGIEAALVSLIEPGDRVLVPVFGRFGHLLREIAERCGAGSSNRSRSRRPWSRLHGEAMLAGVRGLGLTVFGDVQRKMNNCVGVEIPPGIDGDGVRRVLLERFGIEIGTSFGPLHGRIWRIGTMGYNARTDAVLTTLAALEQVLRRAGVGVPVGGGVDAALDVYG